MVRLAALLIAFGLVHSAHAQTVQPPAAAKAKPAAKKPPAPKAAAATPAPSGPCSIGVFPLLGNRFDVSMPGRDKFKQITVENWGLDDLVIERLRAAVGRGTAVRRVAYAKGAFDGYGPTAPIFQTDSKSSDLVRRAAAQTQCERYIVVTRSNVFIGNRPTFGIGLVNSGIGSFSVTVLHAVVGFVIYDGHSFAVLKRGTGSPGGRLLSDSPAIRLQGFPWPERPEEVNTPAMREATRKLLGDVLDNSLPKMLAR
ncbi:MAG: hypothetical protein ABIL01_03665 [Pseudomonadota bacterium]